jgi:very-short-patch-repair endonuclease
MYTCHRDIVSLPSDMDRVKAHNREVMLSARNRAEEMKMFPSKLEERMIAFLDHHGIRYELQKIFYIYDEDGWIKRYYIADFFIPQRNIIIEVDGKFHDDHKQKDRDRTRDIQQQYPEVEVLRYKWKDLSDLDMMDDLLCRIA